MSQPMLMILCCITFLLIGRQLCWHNESPVVSQSFIVLILCSRERAKLYFSTYEGAIFGRPKSKKSSVRSLKVMSLDFHFCDRFSYPGRSIRETFYLLARGYSGEHENSAQTALNAGNNIGIHTISNHYRVLRMSIKCAQCGTHHERVRFANEVRFDAGSLAN